MRRTAPLLTIAVAVAIAASACGGSDDEYVTPTTPAQTGTTTTERPEPSTTATSPGQAPPADAHGSFARCLSEHGVSEPPSPQLGPAPGPAPAPPGVDADTWDDAVQECAGLGPGPAG